jgi:hypothetical protein
MLAPQLGRVYWCATPVLWSATGSLFRMRDISIIGRVCMCVAAVTVDVQLCLGA